MDSASNLTSDPTSTALFAWDSRNQLTSVTNGPASSFTASYDAILRRDSQTTAFGGTTSYVHDNKDVSQSNNTAVKSTTVVTLRTVCPRTTCQCFTLAKALVQLRLGAIRICAIV